ncbi:MAG: DeoR/GlpR family DNA-binding transcription regulator [Rikenellaceae bacterium]
MGISLRHTKILELLKQNNSVSVSELAEILQVSLVTIRKDLSQLEEQKLLYRSHGSAILINPYINERHVNEKEKLARVEKQAISRAAAALINARDSIIIASGTTMTFFASEINVTEPLTVITSSVVVSQLLACNKNIEVIQLGGFVRNSSISVVGNYAERMMENFSCSKLYLGVDGIDLEYGLTTTSSPEASLNRAMISAAQKTIVLCDSSKFGRRGFGRICKLDEIDQIITDSKISPKIAEKLREQGIEVTIV